MKKVLFLKLNAEMLKMMSKSGIKIEDYRYIGAYEKFQSMRNNKVKYRAAISIIAAEENISERTLERIIRRLSGEIY